ncbi:hypothetical protein LBBP_04012 [Leptospira borgpetersenii serovar Ballum]|uniref:Uncharacterized protein n=1 Tax=Leptospira borgpetersenii serovar Ballum TaxID=280505 RepID=A0A0S2IWZ5_LEPBO|nr:hypothetical protein LBBP_04012 [Leptospira borgpetersenii serovar Ballum]
MREGLLNHPHRVSKWALLFSAKEFLDVIVIIAMNRPTRIGIRIFISLKFRFRRFNCFWILFCNCLSIL